MTVDAPDVERNIWCCCSNVLTSATSRDATEIGSGLPSLRWLSASTGSDGCYQTPARSALTRNPELWLQSQSCVRQCTSHCGWPASGRCPSCRAEDDSTTESVRRKGWRLWGLCKGISPLALGCGADASVGQSSSRRRELVLVSQLSQRLRWTLCWAMVTASLSSSLRLRLKQLCVMLSLNCLAANGKLNCVSVIVMQI